VTDTQSTRHRRLRIPTPPRRRRRRLPTATRRARAAGQRPLRWWEIIASREPARLPFGELFLEALAGGGPPRAAAGQTAPQAGPVVAQSRIVEPVEGWSVFLEQRRRVPPRSRRPWGEHTELIEDWFDAGEALQDAEPEPQNDEPQPWTRALSWMRSMLGARLRPV